MSEDFALLDKQELDELSRLWKLYYQEARQCKASNAYLAGCVMLGAALETDLTSMVATCVHEVSTHSKRRPKKPLLKWSFGELLDVANELNWLPGDEPPDDKLDPLQWPIGMHARVIRLLRNLVHPARYLQDLHGCQITAEELEASFKVVDRIHLRLLTKLPG